MTIEASIDLDSPIWGAKRSHRSFGVHRHKYIIARAGLIPAKKVGKSWVTTRRQLLALSDATQ